MTEKENYLRGISVRIGSDKYVLPIMSVKQSFKAKKEDIMTDPDGNEMIKTQGSLYCLLRANAFFDIAPVTDIEEGLVVVLEDGNRRVGLLVDELTGQMDVNVLPLPEHFGAVKYLRGCSVTNDSELVLVIHVQDLFSNVNVGLWEPELPCDREEDVVNGAAEINLPHEDTTKDKYLSFMINNETYCLAVSAVNEIISLKRVRKVPNAPSSAEGIISLRNKIVPVINIRKRFLMDSAEDDESTCIVVVEQNETFVGVKVDKVGEVVFIEESMIQSPPSASGKRGSQYIHGIGRIGDKLVQMLDLDKFLDIDQRE